VTETILGGQTPVDHESDTRRSDTRARVLAAIEETTAGHPVVLLDDSGNTGTLVVAASKATEASFGFLVEHTSGFLCAALPGEDCERLTLPPMWHRADAAGNVGYTVTVDVVHGTTTGISAADRARTARALADPTTAPADFTRPGHLIPIRIADSGILAARGLGEASVELAVAADLRPVSVFADIVSTEDPTQMADAAQAREFAALHELCAVSIDDLWLHRLTHTTPKRLFEERRVSRRGALTSVHYGGFGDARYVAHLLGSPMNDTVPVYFHVEHAADVLAVWEECDCRSRLDDALARLSVTGGVVVSRAAAAPGHGPASCRGVGWASELDLAASRQILGDLGYGDYSYIEV
jgi:3,4-dihydroxy 2-butanone 4-phosphate synthase/GTP cyclohydrolase II